MRTGRIRTLIWSLAALFAAFTLLSPTASAQTATPAAAAPSFIIAPSGDAAGPYFTETMTAGEKKTLTVSLGNAGDAPAAAITYAADAYSLINGGFGVRTDGSPATGTTAWLDYPSATLDLQPKKVVERAFTVTVPKGTAPGQYIAGLVLQTAEPIAVAGSPMLRQTIAKSIAVFITVPGAVKPALAIGAASVSTASGARVLSIAVKNPGNVLVKPAGMATIADAAGKAVVTMPITMDSVYAGMTTSVEFPIAASVAAGDYTISVQLKDAATGAAASVSKVPLTLPDLNEATPVPNPVSIASIALDPARDAGGKLKYVNVDVKIANTGDPIANSRLILHVALNGAPVEDFVLSSSLAVPRGVTDVTARYLPAGDWAAGTYGFSVTLDAVDPGTGQATTIASALAPATVAGP